MSNYITTYTGKHFEPTNPDQEAICIEDIAHALSLITRGNGHVKTFIEDIAHALSLITRGNGHVKTFWSVGEHCLCCAKEAAARGLSDRLILACLLHDASECYMSDIPRPFKKELPEYCEHENHLLDLIYEKFLGDSLTAEEQVQLKAIDDALLWYDLTILLGERPGGEAPKLKVMPDYAVRPFAEVEQEYLEMFREYSK